MTAPSPTWALVADIRARILAYDAAAFVPRPLGQAEPSARRHKLVEIVEVGPTSRLHNTYSDRTAISVERGVFLQAFYSIGSDDAALDAAEEEAGRWFDGLREALVNYAGDAWATTRHIRFVDEPVALGRAGGYMFYQLRLSSEIPISVGTVAVPPP